MSDLEIIYAGGEVRTLGCRPRLAAVGELFPVWTEKQVTIPRYKWQPCSWRHLVRRIMDQDGVGACNAFAACQALETCRAMAGQPHVELFPGNLYGRINGGRDQGSVLGDALRALTDDGVIVQLNGVQPWEWGRKSRPDDWETEAAKYRILEAYDCPTFEHIASAIQCGFLVDFGVMVGNDFNPGADLWVPDYRRGGGGHAMCGVGLVERSGKWGILTANSWGERWGDGGFCVVPESYFQGTYNDAWAVRAVVQES